MHQAARVQAPRDVGDRAHGAPPVQGRPNVVDGMEAVEAHGREEPAPVAQDAADRGLRHAPPGTEQALVVLPLPARLVGVLRDLDHELAEHGVDAVGQLAPHPQLRMAWQTQRKGWNRPRCPIDRSAGGGASPAYARQNRSRSARLTVGSAVDQ